VCERICRTRRCAPKNWPYPPTWKWCRFVRPLGTCRRRASRPPVRHPTCSSRRARTTSYAFGTARWCRRTRARPIAGRSGAKPTTTSIVRWKWTVSCLSVSMHVPTITTWPGKILSIACAHSCRLACVFDPLNLFNTTHAEIINVEIAIYECESTGGAEWVSEDRLPLHNIRIPRSSSPTNDFELQVLPRKDDRYSKSLA